MDVHNILCVLITTHLMDHHRETIGAQRPKDNIALYPCNK